MAHFLTHAHVHVLLFRLYWWTTCVNRLMGLIVAGALWIWSWIGSWERCHKRFQLYQTWPKSAHDFINKLVKEVRNCVTVHPLLVDFCTAMSSLPNLNDRIMLFGFIFVAFHSIRSTCCFRSLYWRAWLCLCSLSLFLWVFLFFQLWREFSGCLQWPVSATSPTRYYTHFLAHA